MKRLWPGVLVLAWAGAVHAQDTPAVERAASAPPLAANDRSAPPRLVAGSCRPPDYPLASVRAKEAGTAVVRVNVNEKGEPSQAAVDTSSGHVRLDRAFRYALMSCKFHPGLDTIGNPLPGVARVRHTWRLEDALEDPWVGLRAAVREARWTATEDLDAVTFTAPSAATTEQRAKILRRVREAARENAGCPSIERVSPAPAPASWKMPTVVTSASGRPVRIVSELWNATQCDTEMAYSLVLRFPEDEPAYFVMIPIPAEPAVGRDGATVPSTYGQRVAALVGAHVVHVAGPLKPVAEVELRMKPDGRITDTRLTRPSGDLSWDRAVLDAVARTGRLPKDRDGLVPPVVVFSMRAK